MAVGSFSAGLSGLNANSQALSVIGNNLSNINTVGFKASRVNFSDLVSQNVGAASDNPAQVGLGVGLGSISPIFKQGAIESTNEATNVAIQGNGFFVLDGPNGRSYTRAGAFSFDNSGNLVSPDGQFVQGFTGVDPATGKIDATGSPANITVAPGQLRPATPTSQFTATTNLNAADPTNATWATPVQIYDSLGTAHVLTMSFEKSGAGAWTYELTAPGAEVTGGTAGTPFVIDSGTLTFGSDGKLSQVDGAAPANVTFTTPTWT